MKTLTHILNAIFALFAIALLGGLLVGADQLPDYSQINQQPLLRADNIRVYKHKRILQLLNKKKVFRQYHIALGQAPEGHKVQQGDERTPEGHYVIDWRNPNSIAYKSLHISYPNAQDIKKSKKLGVSPGGNIMIHGIVNGFSNWGKQLQQFDWTDGCIAVLDHEMEEIWQSVPVGTKIHIYP